jgi:hypothetical protein
LYSVNDSDAERVCKDGGGRADRGQDDVGSGDQEEQFVIGAEGIKLFFDAAV